MAEAALSVAIAAIAITLFGVILQWLAYRATIDQAQKAAQSVADMRTEIHGLVGELRGMTERMVEAQERQFNRMLDAFVTRPAAAAEVAESTGESADRLQQISEEMAALKEEMRRTAGADEVQRKLDELATRVEAVSASTAQAARLAEAAVPDRTPARRKQVPLVIQPGKIPAGGSVRIRLFGVSSLFARTRCEVTAPDNSTSIAWFAQTSGALPFEGLLLAFPDHFEGASTDTAGRYEVAAYRMSTLEVLAGLSGAEELLGTGFFLVEGGPQP